MRCPGCNGDLKEYKYGRNVVDICPSCKGVWFDSRELKEFVDSLLRERNDIPDADIILDRDVERPAELPGQLKSCHCCRTVNYAYDSNIILDRCAGCEGIWADGGEVYKLAVHRKGNPHLHALGTSLVEEQKNAQRLDDLLDVSASLGRSPAWVLFGPRIILPFSDDIKTGIVPGVVIAIIALNLAIFAYQSVFVEDLSSFFRAFGLIPAAVLSGGGYFSFISSMFLHVGILHLVGNMFFFWIFGDNVEEALGHWRFLGFYLLFGFVASLLHILTNMQSSIPTIGASGAVAGGMGAYLVRYPYAKVKTLFICRVIDIPAYFYLGGWIVLQVIYGMIYLSAGGHSGIAWFAHIGGFAAGMLLMWFSKSAEDRNKRREGASIPGSR